MAWAAARALLRRHREPLLLGSLILSLTAAVAVEAMSSDTREAAPVRRTLALPELDARASGATGPSDQWQDTVLGRPLFALDRRPLPVEAAADGTLPRLSGTIRFANTALAIFEIPPAGGDAGHAPAKSLVLGAGADIAGWTIQTVADERVLLTKAGEVRSLQLAFTKASQTPTKPASAIRVLHGKRTNVFFQP